MHTYRVRNRGRQKEEGCSGHTHAHAHNTQLAVAGDTALNAVQLPAFCLFAIRRGGLGKRERGKGSSRRGVRRGMLWCGVVRLTHCTGPSPKTAENYMDNQELFFHCDLTTCQVALELSVFGAMSYVYMCVCMYVRACTRVRRISLSDRIAKKKGLSKQLPESRCRRLPLQPSLLFLPGFRFSPP
ncbi:hypothetical protein F4775DRAFT_328204 [Biscogniauxia sp. FL1348]|nr:hypothetical protein F4775DRAFT_328204 [Biscogniauxia sp. FL1348]